jgi:hypothetical protein
MNDYPGLVQINAFFLEQFLNRFNLFRQCDDRQTLSLVSAPMAATRSSWRCTSWRRSANLVGFRHPMRKQLVGVLAAVGQSQGYIGQIAQQSAGQRVLTEYGKDNHRVKMALA